MSLRYSESIFLNIQMEHFTEIKSNCRCNLFLLMKGSSNRTYTKNWKTIFYSTPVFMMRNFWRYNSFKIEYCWALAQPKNTHGRFEALVFWQQNILRQTSSNFTFFWNARDIIHYLDYLQKERTINCAGFSGILGSLAGLQGRILKERSLLYQNKNQRRIYLTFFWMREERLPFVWLFLTWKLY